MPKWMTKCERCHEVVGGEHVLLIGADGIVKDTYCIPCFIAVNLKQGQLDDAVSATWGGGRYEYKPPEHRCNCALVEVTGTPGKRAIPVDEWGKKMERIKDWDEK